MGEKKGLMNTTIPTKRHLNQPTTKPTIKLSWPTRTQISLHIQAVWSEPLLITCAFYSLRAIQRGMNKNPCHTGWMFRLFWVFAGQTGLIVVLSCADSFYLFIDLFIFFFSIKNKSWYFMWSSCYAVKSHEMSRHFQWKILKKKKNGLLQLWVAL